MIYIIILTWNGKKYLSNLFKSLADLNYPKEKYKILVIDSASTDGSIEYLKNLEKQNKIELIKLKTNLGFTAGNNIGMEKAIKDKTDYVFLLNQDTEVDPDFLTHAVAKAKSDEKIGVVQSLTLHLNDKKKIQSLGNQLHFLGYGWSGGNWLDKNTNKFEQESKKMVYASAAAVLYKTAMLKEIGLFDENYFSYHEDSDLCLRAKLHDYKVALARESIVYHAYNFPTNKNKLRYFWNEKNRIYLILKFYKFKTILLLLPMMLAMDLGQLIFAIKRGYTWQWFKSRLWFKFNFHKLFKARRKVQKTRQISDKELTKNFASEIKYQPVNNFLLDKIGNPVMRVYWKIIKNFL